jgi:hypothetical protein
MWRMRYMGRSAFVGDSRRATANDPGENTVDVNGADFSDQPFSDRRIDVAADDALDDLGGACTCQRWGARKRPQPSRRRSAG